MRRSIFDENSEGPFELELARYTGGSNVSGQAFDSLSRLIQQTDEESNEVNLTRNGKARSPTAILARSIPPNVRDGFGGIIRRSSPDIRRLAGSGEVKGDTALVGP